MPNIFTHTLFLCLTDLHYRKTLAFSQSQLTAFETWYLKACCPAPHQHLLIKTDSGICGPVQHYSKMKS